MSRSLVSKETMGKTQFPLSEICWDADVGDDRSDGHL